MHHLASTAERVVGQLVRQRVELDECLQYERGHADRSWAAACPSPASQPACSVRAAAAVRQPSNLLARVLVEAPPLPRPQLSPIPHPPRRPDRSSWGCQALALLTSSTTSPSSKA